MNTALILAGGIDPRFQMNIPKQFVNVNNRPIIVYTLEIFQNHPDIDEIIVTCVDGWQEMIQLGYDEARKQTESIKTLI